MIFLKNCANSHPDSRAACPAVQLIFARQATRTPSMDHIFRNFKRIEIYDQISKTKRKIKVKGLWGWDVCVGKQLGCLK